MKPVRFLLIVLLLAAGFGGGYGYGRWYGLRPAVRRAAERKILYWVDPMHPAYTSDKPGIAPDCGMTLVPVYDDSVAAPAHSAAPAEALPPGAIKISADQQQLMGVRFTEAEYTSNDETVRAVGKIAVDETRIVLVHPRVEGWIEHVQADFIGAQVHAGQPLLTLYSPGMLASQQEYLLALKARDLLAHSSIQTTVLNSDSLIEASRRRLELWNLSKPQMEELERTSKPVPSVIVESPASGTITARNAFTGQKVTPETEIYAITDLSRVWIMAEVFESDLPKIRLGQAGIIHLPYNGGAEFTAHVTYIQPQVDAQTRTVKVRLEAPNPNMQLMPEMFVDVALRISTGRQLTVPADAVLDSGENQTVFVDRGNGVLEPRAVHVGGQVGDRVVILHGLAPGERVAGAATFLLDSESQLHSAATAPAGAHKHD